MHARLRDPSNLLTLHQIINEPDFPSSADEIAEPRSDMNIKVAAFTVSETSIKTLAIVTLNFVAEYELLREKYGIIRSGDWWK